MSADLEPGLFLCGMIGTSIFVYNWWVLTPLIPQCYITQGLVLSARIKETRELFPV